MTQKKTLMCMLTVMFATILVFGCGQKQEEAPQATAPVTPIKIGAVLSVTGPAAKLGGPEKNAALMIVDQVNAAGGINGRPIQLIIEDDQADPEKTQNAVKKLITSDGVCAIFGPTTSGCAFAAGPICEEAGVPLVSCAAAFTQLFTDRDPSKPMYKYVFKTPQNDTSCARKIFEHCKSVGSTKVAIITDTAGFGAAGRAELLKNAAEFGIKIVADETYPPDATDLTPQLTSIRTKKPQAIINWSISPAQALIAGQVKQLKMKVQLYQSHGFGNKGYITEAAEGVIFPAGRLLVVNDIDSTNVQYSVLKNFKQDYETKYGEEVSTFAGHAHDSLWLIINAIKAKSDDRTAIRDALEATTNFVGTAGVVNMSATDHCGLTDDAFALLTVKNGTFTLLK